MFCDRCSWWLSHFIYVLNLITARQLACVLAGGQILESTFTVSPRLAEVMYQVRATPSCPPDTRTATAPAPPLPPLTRSPTHPVRQRLSRDVPGHRPRPVSRRHRHGPSNGRAVRMPLYSMPRHSSDRFIHLSVRCEQILQRLRLYSPQLHSDLTLVPQGRLPMAVAQYDRCVNPRFDEQHQELEKSGSKLSGAVGFVDFISRFR